MFVTSIEEESSQRKLTASASMEGWGVIAKLSASMSSKSSYSEENIYYVASFKNHFSFSGLNVTNPEFTKHAKDVLMEEGPEKFEEYFGSYYVTGFVQGSYAKITNYRKITDKSKIDEVKASIEAEYKEVGFSVQGEVGAKAKTASKQQKTETKTIAEFIGTENDEKKEYSVDDIVSIKNKMNHMTAQNSGNKLLTIVKSYKNHQKYLEYLCYFRKEQKSLPKELDKKGLDDLYEEASRLQILNDLVKIGHQTYPKIDTKGLKDLRMEIADQLTAIEKLSVSETREFKDCIQILKWETLLEQWEELKEPSIKTLPIQHQLHLKPQIVQEFQDWQQNNSSNGQTWSTPVMERFKLPQEEEVKEISKNDSCKVVALVGKTGTGKSALCNVLLDAFIKPQETSAHFKVSSGIDSMTYKCLHANGAFLGNKNLNDVTVLDTPGLSDTKDRDAQIMTDMINYIKMEVGRIDYILLTLNGQEPRIDAQTYKIIDQFVNSFGKNIWYNLGIVYTRWSFRDEPVMIREDNGLSEQTRKDEIREKLQERYPSNKDEIENLSIFFLDQSDFRFVIMKQKAQTYDEKYSVCAECQSLTELENLYQQIHDHRGDRTLKVKDMSAVVVSDYKDQWEKLIETIKKNFDILQNKQEEYKKNSLDDCQVATQFNMYFKPLVDQEEEFYKRFQKETFARIYEILAQSFNLSLSQFDLLQQQRLTNEQNSNKGLQNQINLHNQAEYDRKAKLDTDVIVTIRNCQTKEYMLASNWAVGSAFDQEVGIQSSWRIKKYHNNQYTIECLDPEYKARELKWLWSNGDGVWMHSDPDEAQMKTWTIHERGDKIFRIQCPNGKYVTPPLKIQAMQINPEWRLLGTQELVAETRFDWIIQRKN